MSIELLASERTSCIAYLARHGQTSSNLDGRYAGSSAEPLTPLGRQQVLELGERVATTDVAEIWTSSIARARESAEILGAVLGVSVRVEPRLDEMRMGPWEGLTEDEVAQRFPVAHAVWQRAPDRLVWDGRETLPALSERVSAVVSEASRRARPVLLVTHVAPIRVAALSTLGLPLRLYKHLRVGNGDCIVLQRAVAHAVRLGGARSLRYELPVTTAESIPA